MLRKLFTHSFLYSVAPQIPKIVTVFLLPIITKNVTAYDYGVYGVITSYLFFVAALKDLGFGVIFVNSYYKYPKRWKFLWKVFWGHLTIWSLIFSVIVFLLLLFALPRQEFKHFAELAFLIIVPILLFDNTNLIGNYYYRFSERPLYIAVITICTGIVTIITTYYCIVNLRLGYLSWFIATFAASFVMFLFYAFPVFLRLKLFPIIKWKTRIIKPYLKVSLPMIPHNYSSYLLNSSDRVVLDLYKVNLRQVGIYNIAYTFGNYFEAIGDALGMAVAPFYSKLYASGKKEDGVDARNLTLFLMCGFLSACFLVSLWLKEIFGLLVKNDELSSGYAIGIFIIMGYAYRPMYWSSGIKLSIFESTSSLWRISFVAGLLNVLLNIIFVPFFGIMASAISTLISLLYMGFAGFYLKAYKKLPQTEHYPIFWIVLILALTAFTYLIRDSNILFKGILTLLLIASMTFLFFKKYSYLKKIRI